MVNRVAPPTTQACVWMSAGLLSYKLCDHEFDCAHCPLDAALRGTPPRIALRAGTLEAPAPRTPAYPDDRVYTTGHTWLEPTGAGDGHLRFGLDSFATSIIAEPCGVRWTTTHGVLHRGETLCEVDFEPGSLALGAPIVACVSRWNQALETDPAAMVTAPYGDGWLVELAPVGPEDLAELLNAKEARRQARLDARLFLRHAAMQMLFDHPAPGESRPDGGAVLTDLRRILGGPRYLELLRDLVH